MAGQILAAASGARWPMYLRNVKQILRRRGGFDERRYGFGGLMDLLKACQREGFVRVERDRRGGLRVFQGSALAQWQRRADADRAGPIVPQAEVEDSLRKPAIESVPTPVAATPDEPAVNEPEPGSPDSIDTTAELLGRAKPRKPRARAPASRPPDAATPQAASAKKPRGSQVGRGKKAPRHSRGRRPAKRAEDDAV